jgi:hypothetical protein
VNTSETDWVIVLNAHDLGVNFSDDMNPRNRRSKCVRILREHAEDGSEAIAEGFPCAHSTGGRVRVADRRPAAGGYSHQKKQSGGPRRTMWRQPPPFILR